MATFLKICQDIARESGTVAAPLSTVAVGPDKWTAKIVAWGRQAWIDIQNAHESWRFLREEFEDALSVGTATYTPASFSSIENFGAWRNEAERGDTVTIYDPDIGPADEGALRHLDWDTFKRQFRRGVQTNNKPGYWSINPKGEFCLGPAPDKAYIVKGEYIRAPQELTKDDDIPICPAQFHSVIVWYALVLLVEHDSDSVFDLAAATRRYNKAISDLEYAQLPGLRLAGPLA